MTTIRFEVGRGKTDVRTFDVELADAAPATVGEDPSDEPDFTMIMKPDELDAVVAGERSLDVGYMQGTVKVTGNLGRLLSVLPLLTTPEFAAGLGEAAAG